MKQTINSAHSKRILEHKAPDPTDYLTDRKLVLSARDVHIEFALRGKTLQAVRGCSLDLYEGETLAIVGESGAGKSVFTKSFVGMLDKNGKISQGEIIFEGTDLAKLETDREWSQFRGGKLGMILQDPMTSLNPLKTVGKQIEESVTLHQGLRGSAAKKDAIHMLELVGLTDAKSRYSQYPHQLSGGMRQRVVIAIAVACHPKVLICDEPTTSLDVTVQAQILQLIRDLQAQFNMSLIYITHDLGVVASVADRVSVMYGGQIIESGLVEEIFYNAWHPYTWALLGAMPQLGQRGKPLPAIDGAPPNLFSHIQGDAFAPRNKQALKIDFVEEPPIFRISPTHTVKTWQLSAQAPKIEQPPHILQLPSLVRGESEDKNHKLTEEILQTKEVLIETKNLQVAFGKGAKRFVALNNINLQIFRGETFALVGESGSGKTTLGRALLRINPVTKGEVLFKGKRISGKISKAQDLEVIRKCQMIFQDPMSSLNERAKVAYIVSEGLLNHHLYTDKEDLNNKISQALQAVGLLPEFASRFPHEFSGGQRQRIGIARALVMRPEFIVADEPISSLDMSIRAQILNLLNNLKKAYKLTYLFITHDLSVVRFIADRIAVIHLGNIVELATAEELFHNPIHPYTKALLSAVPVPDPGIARNREIYSYDPSRQQNTLYTASWHEILPGHFVLASDQELRKYLGGNYHYANRYTSSEITRKF